MRAFSASVVAFFVAASNAQKIVITNDDGWATAQIRAEYNALKAAGYDVILSAPAENASGTGSLSIGTPPPLLAPCEFNTCPAGSPGVGSDATDPQINYVNGFPVDAVKHGIQTLSPQFFGSPPDLVISGSNIGNNLGIAVLGSGTVGATSEAVKEGIPAVAFSGASGSQVSFTTLSNATAPSTIAANIYTDLILQFTAALLANPAPILPSGTSLNVNFAVVDSCLSAASYKFVLTRVFSNILSTDVTTCGTNHLPTESSAIKNGCIATVSVLNASTKLDANAATQQVVLNKLSSILSCL
ncbi:sure-like protein [Agrocybe pediades]|nr:sure-like protein [Agrocybe pediades]